MEKSTGDNNEVKHPEHFPPEAKLVFKGVLFDVYQWNQRMFDGSYRTFERLKRRDAVIVVPITDEGTILVSEQEQPAREPFYTTAGGVVDEGETPLEAAKRELLEETGYVSDDWWLWQAIHPSGKIAWTIYIYIAKGCHKVEERHLDVGEKISVRLVSFDEFVEFVLDKKFREISIMFKFLEAKAYPEKMEEIKKLFFG